MFLKVSQLQGMEMIVNTEGICYIYYNAGIRAYDVFFANGEKYQFNKAEIEKICNAMGVSL